ncbi:MAG: C-GCAxxG-C-C family protein [Clostridia bacterium]|nr:C-GCAxxG-C-C family protein [Clostridia bacterium]
MSEKIQKALDNHHKGYNCAQSVACAFAEELGMDEKELFKMMEGFGFGMGCMGTCGAVSGMTAVAGLKESDGNLEQPASKKASYRASKKMIKAFEEKNGSVICKEIKGVDTGKVLRSCDGCVEDAAEIVEKNLKGEIE